MTRVERAHGRVLNPPPLPVGLHPQRALPPGFEPGTQDSETWVMSNFTTGAGGPPAPRSGGPSPRRPYVRRARIPTADRFEPGALRVQCPKLDSIVPRARPRPSGPAEIGVRGIEPPWTGIRNQCVATTLHTATPSAGLEPASSWFAPRRSSVELRRFTRLRQRRSVRVPRRSRTSLHRVAADDGPRPPAQGASLQAERTRSLESAPLPQGSGAGSSGSRATALRHLVASPYLTEVRPDRRAERDQRTEISGCAPAWAACEAATDRGGLRSHGLRDVTPALCPLSYSIVSFRRCLR